MGRFPCCDESGLKKGPWTPEEDEKLLQYIQKNGHGSWRTLPRLAGTYCTDGDLKSSACTHTHTISHSTAAASVQRMII
jgi:hypothetical protein